MSSQINSMLQQAIHAFQTGNSETSDAILKRVIQIDKNNLPALHILGLVRASLSDYVGAVDLLRKAASINPNDASIQFNLAKALSDCNLDKDALLHHKKSVSLTPDNLGAWLNYGKSLSNLGRHVDALVCFDRALSIKPDYAEALLNKSATLKYIKRYDEAIGCVEKAILNNSSLIEAWANKGAILHEVKRFDEALECYNKALELKPDSAEGWSNKALTLHELKRFDDALECYNKALELKPDSAEAWSNKALTLYELRQFDEALEHFETALTLNQNPPPEGWSNKAIALHELKRFDEALGCYDKALELNPNSAELLTNKAVALYELNRLEEVIANYEKAIKLTPDFNWLCGDLLHTKMKICDWRNLEYSLQDITEKIFNKKRAIHPFALLALTDDGALHQKAAEIYVENSCPSDTVLGPMPKYSEKQKIRIGYYSADFRKHAVSALIAELFELHDRNSFEIYAFSSGVDDKSPIRQRVLSSFDQYFDVTGIPDKQIAILSRKMEIDIAVDLGGFTSGNRPGIFAYRAAPIQVSYLGYLGTLGSKYIDYLIADQALILKNFEQFYSEKIIYLPSYQVNDRKRIISNKKFNKEELGLPNDAFVFCCFNSNYKILPSTFDNWMFILKEVKKSVLYLYAENSWAINNLKKEAESRGVNSNRLIFANSIPYEDYLARYAVCDLFLDTYPYNAGTTASDALWAGLPVLTLQGQSFASRMASSLLISIGLPELIAISKDEYVALAIELAIKPEKLAVIKNKLTAYRNCKPLFDTPLFTKNIEKAYLGIYKRYRQGLSPEHFMAQ